MAALKEIATSLVIGQEYDERAVNELIKSRHTFGDHSLLRREMVEAGVIQRTRDGKKYWREDVQ